MDKDLIYAILIGFIALLTFFLTPVFVVIIVAVFTVAAVYSIIKLWDEDF